MKRIAAILAAAVMVLIFAPAAHAAVDTKGPNITMQATGHLLTHAPVQYQYGSFSDGSQVYSTQVDVRWSGSDPSGICDYQVWNDSGRDYPSLIADVGKATHYQLRSGDIDQGSGGYNYTRLEIRAMDCAGNWSVSGYNYTGGDDPDWPFPATDRALNLPDNLSYLASHDNTEATYSGAGDWTLSNCACFMGGTDLHAVRAGASMTYVANYASWSPGSSTFGLVSAYGPTRGSFKIYQDGVYKATVSLYAKTNTGAQVVWSAYFPTVGPHTYKVVVVGTAGHPRVDVDGFFTGPLGCPNGTGLCTW